MIGLTWDELTHNDTDYLFRRTPSEHSPGKMVNAARLSTEHTENYARAARRRRTRRPVSRVLCRPSCDGRGGHSSGPPIAGRFSRPTRAPETPATAPPALLRRRT